MGKTHSWLLSLLKSIFVIAIGINIPQVSIAQSDKIVVDSISKQSDKYFPFDQSFPLTYPLNKEEKITSALIFQLNKQGCYDRVLPKKCAWTNNIAESIISKYGMKLSEIQKQSFRDTIDDRLKASKCNCISKSEIVSIANEKNISITRKQVQQLKDGINSAVLPYEIKSQFIHQNKGAKNVTIIIPPLQPNKRYLLVLISQPQEIKDLDMVIEKLLSSDVAGAKIEYEKIYKQWKNKVATLIPYVECTKCKEETINFEIDSDFDTFKNFYDKVAVSTNDLKTIVSFIDNNTKSVKSKLDAPLEPLHLDSTVIKELIGHAQQCVTCAESSAWTYQWISNRTEMVKMLSYLSFLNNETLRNNVSLGNVRYDSLNFRKISPNEISDKIRIKNLTATLGFLSEVSDFVNYSIVVYHSNVTSWSNFNLKLNKYISEIKGKVDNLNQEYQQKMEYEKKKKDIEQKLYEWEGFSHAISSISNNTFTHNFEIRSGYALKADFGFIFYGNGFGQETLKGFAPYAGFHVNFRQLNTDVPFRLIRRKGFSGRFSFHSGFLLTSLKEEGVRNGLIGETSIYTGLGFAFGHAARIQAGTIWYRANNPNPLINRTSTAVTPYIGLALDIRLKDIYEGFKKIFQP